MSPFTALHICKRTYSCDNSVDWHIPNAEGGGGGVKKCNKFGKRGGGVERP